jgi:3D domain
MYHFAGPYSLTRRNAQGKATEPCRGVPGVWANGSPAWIGPTRLDAAGKVTYPLAAGGWSAGPPAAAERPAAAARFAPGAAISLSYWHDVDVDPRLIPHGSSIFVRAYCGTPTHGWFTAADTGGAIIGRHIDVFRAPPSVPWAFGPLRDQKIYVVLPALPARPRSAAEPASGSRREPTGRASPAREAQARPGYYR